MAEKTYQAGVKDYRKTYWTLDYVPLDTDLLACPTSIGCYYIAG